MKRILLVAVLATSGLAFVPQASAVCRPVSVKEAYVGSVCAEVDPYGPSACTWAGGYTWTTSKFCV